ncbi:MAG: efflux RND transporter periplasmic adaptor subunit [Sphingobacteriales bacterium]|nr:MAG: efflux RND transporter periplasmic adaptor subunit [Sphingobacteriales bacterium]
MSLLGLQLTSCTTEKKQQETSGKVPVVRIKEGDIRLDRVYVSDIQAAQNVEIRSRISGFLEKIHIDEGAYVKRGQLLFTLSDDELRAEVEKARAAVNSLHADVKTAELEVEKVRLLVDKKIVSGTELEVASARLRAVRARVQEAQASLRHAQARLSYTAIRAPYNGVIDRIPLKAGSLLEEGTLITSVSDISTVFAYFNISENEYLDYLRSKRAGTAEEDAAVRLILADGREYSFEGKIETVVSEFADNTGSIAFRARFPNPQGLLKHGASGKVKLSREVEDALMLPQKAVFEIQDKNYVFVLDKSNTVRMRNFIPRARVDDYYVVESGVQEGDQIVYEGIQTIRDGMQVQPKLVQLDSLQRKNIL